MKKTINVTVGIIFLLILVNTVRAISDSNQNNNNMSITINIVETKQLRVDFVPIDNFYAINSYSRKP